MKKNNDSDRRGYKRFIAKNGAMAFFNGVQLYGQIVDISLSGLSFLYFHAMRLPYSVPLFHPNGTVEIIYGKNDFSLKRAKVDVISNIKTDSVVHLEKIVTKWRCCLKFKELTSEQLFLLKHFLLTCITNRKFC